MFKNYFLLLPFLMMQNLLMAQNAPVRSTVEKEMENKYEGDRQKGVKAVDERLDTWEASDKAKRANIEAFPTMSMSMSIEYPEKPKNNVTLEYYFKNYECASVFKMERGNGGMDRSIMNFKEGKSTMLMTDKKGRKTGMIMDLKSFDWAVKSAVDKSNKQLEDGDATITATDEYKTIEGYKCRKYIFEDQNNKSEMWICTDIGIEHVKFNKAFLSAFSNAKNMNNNAFYKAGMHGVVIQTHIYPKGGRSDEAIMTMKNIKVGYAPDEMFSTAGYELTAMPSMKDIWKSANEKQ